MKRTMIIVAVGAGLVTAAIAHGQPLPDVPIPPDNSGSGSAQPPPPPPPQPGGTETPAPPETPTDPYAPLPPPKPKKPLPPLYMPEVLTTPTGFLLPAAVLYSKTSIDTGGGVTSDTRVGPATSPSSVSRRPMRCASAPTRTTPISRASSRT